MARRTVEVQMRWSDMDALGHVHNAAYLQYLELARLPIFVGLREVTGNRANVVVARHAIDYRAELRYRAEPVLVDIWVNRVGTSSCEVGYRVYDGATGTAYVDATSALVAVDGESRSATAWTPKQRSVLEGLADEESS